jgi:glycosyltransferase involved in cell wall biosynthesis
VRVLHVGSGFRPLRLGGLVAYIEDLMNEQVRRGDDVAYFFAGRYYPFGKPRLKRWRRDGVTMLEVVNSPLYDHGRQPELELDEPRLERIFESVLRELRPDAVHVQELAGLPSSILEIARQAEIPVLFTLQDYFALCPTFKLIDADGATCLRREVGAECVRTTAADPRPPELLFEATVRHDLETSRLMRCLPGSLRTKLIGKAVSASNARVRRRDARISGRPSAEAFQRRRDVNVERLNRTDVVIAMSNRVSEIYSALGVRPDRLRTLQLTLEHLDGLRPKTVQRISRPVTFATLGGGESVEKGGKVLLDAARMLAEEASQGRFRLLIQGRVNGAIAREAASVAGVELGRRFKPNQLDAVLDEVDVGVMPSIWEEAYGYAGVEFLAKGIPVIANAIGGMTEYARDGETGWLNRSCSAAELARIMRDIVKHPEQVAQMNTRILAARDRIIMPMARHGDELDAVYRELGARA